MGYEGLVPLAPFLGHDAVVTGPPRIDTMTIGNGNVTLVHFNSLVFTTRPGDRLAIIL